MNAQTAHTMPQPSISLPLPGANGVDGVISVNYDGFIDDVSVGDMLLVDGGIMSFGVVDKNSDGVEVQTGCLQRQNKPCL